MIAYLTDLQSDPELDLNGDPFRYFVTLSYISSEPINTDDISQMIDKDQQTANCMICNGAAEFSVSSEGYYLATLFYISSVPIRLEDVPSQIISENQQTSKTPKKKSKKKSTAKKSDRALKVKKLEVNNPVQFLEL